MRLKSKLILYALFATLLAGLCMWLWLSLRQNARMRQELVRGRENLHAAMVRFDTTRDAHGRAVAEAARLRLTVGELEEERLELAERVRAMGIKLNRLTALSETRMRTIADLRGRVDTVFVTVADSVRVTVDTLRSFAYDDGHLALHATINDSLGTYEARVESVDTLIQVVHKVRSGWWIFGCTKGIRQTIRSSNPHTKIVYQEYIEFEK